jgi:PAS domain-containing protein
LGLLLVGLSLWLLDVETRPEQRPAEVCALCGALLSLAALLGYTFDAESLYAVGTFYPIALPTAVTLHLLSLGVLCSRPDRGLMRTWTGDDAGGVVVRRLLPVTVVTLCLVGALQSAGERRGLYTAAFGNALQTSVGVVILSLLIWRNAGALQRVDERRQAAEAELRRSKEHLGVTLQSIGDAVLATDRAGRVTGMNPIAERLTGWRQADALGRPIGEVFRIVNEFTREPSTIPVDEVLSTGESRARWFRVFDCRQRRADPRPGRPHHRRRARVPGRDDRPRRRATAAGQRTALSHVVRVDRRGPVSHPDARRRR